MSRGDPPGRGGVRGGGVPGDRSPSPVAGRRASVARICSPGRPSPVAPPPRMASRCSARAHSQCRSGRGRRGWKGPRHPGDPLALGALFGGGAGAHSAPSSGKMDLPASGPEGDRRLRSADRRLGPFSRLPGVANSLRRKRGRHRPLPVRSPHSNGTSRHRRRGVVDPREAAGARRPGLRSLPANIPRGEACLRRRRSSPFHAGEPLRRIGGQ